MLAVALKSLAAMSTNEALAAVARCGVQHVEIEAGKLLDANHLREHGLSVTTLDATELDAADERWVELIDRAHDLLGCRIIIVSAGDDGGDHARRETLFKQHRGIADRAAQAGLVLALDTLPGLCGDTRGMVGTLDQLQHPAVKLNFDTGRYLQLNPWSSGEVALQRVFGLLASVRLTNFTVGVEPLEYSPLGQGGDVDFSRTWQILGGLGFSGPCTIAFQPATRRPPTGEQCAAWLHQSIQHLRGCGWMD